MKESSDVGIQHIDSINIMLPSSKLKPWEEQVVAFLKTVAKYNSCNCKKTHSNIDSYEIAFCLVSKETMTLIK